MPTITNTNLANLLHKANSITVESSRLDIIADMIGVGDFAGAIQAASILSPQEREVIPLSVWETLHPCPPPAG